VLVTAQHGWVGHWPLRDRLGLRLLWQGVMPFLATTLGRFPSCWFGLGEDLPRGVALDWAAWGRRRAHLGSWGGHAALRIPLLVYAVSDDRLAPPRAVEALVRQYARAAIMLRSVDPEEFGLDALGHWAFFRAGVMTALWHEVATFLGEGNAG
jgi:predicted alpha/beta hydrolase